MSMRTFESSSFASPRDDYQPETEAPAESVSLIDRFSNFDGTYRSSRDVRIEGQVKGTIDCQGTLHIAQGASVDAKIEAENISVAGELDGDINCRGRLQILPSGRVRGRINTVTLVINEGAFYEGELEMADAERPISTGRSTRARSSLTSTANPTPISAPSEPVDEPVSSSPTSTNGGSTFIRRFGGQETAWDDANGPSPSDEDQPDLR